MLHRLPRCCSNNSILLSSHESGSERSENSIRFMEARRKNTTTWPWGLPGPNRSESTGDLRHLDLVIGRVGRRIPKACWEAGAPAGECLPRVQEAKPRSSQGHRSAREVEEGRPDVLCYMVSLRLPDTVRHMHMHAQEQTHTYIYTHAHAHAHAHTEVGPGLAQDSMGCDERQGCVNLSVSQVGSFLTTLERVTGCSASWGTQQLNTGDGYCYWIWVAWS